MKKTKVVVASLLKPIDDTRMYEKFGLSMAETNKYDINIIGFDSKNVRSSQGISFYPHGPFTRTSMARIFQPWRIFRKLVKLKPEVIIVNTHELLIVTFWYKILFGGKFIYDIRENYAKNIRETNVFPALLRWPLATWVRLKEWLSRPLIDHYILAERIYERQLPFLSSSRTIIENKYAPQPEESTAYRDPDPSHIDLLYTGTISESNGIFDAIDITKSLHLIDSKVKLRIVGYCALKKDLMRLHKEIESHDFIELNGGDHLVPHREIVEAIQKADFGFVLKKPNNGTNDEKILTRLFEYTANQLPILLLNNPTWIEFCAQYQAAIEVDPQDFDAQTLLEKMKTTDFYTQGNTNDSLWYSEKTRLLDLMGQFS
ncbi:glycosyltransferase [Roseivirga sp.]|uniref:glycosyltransferase n=1 Tax=Roseivirga sp. TaxID=1964215 RepID=UPI003B526966